MLLCPENGLDFLADQEYGALLKELPAELKPLFVTAYETEIRLGELLVTTALALMGWDASNF